MHRRTLKALALTTTLAVTLSLAACGGDDDSGSGTDATSAKGPITIWYSNNEQELAWGNSPWTARLSATGYFVKPCTFSQ